MGLSVQKWCYTRNAWVRENNPSLVSPPPLPPCCPLLHTNVCTPQGHPILVLVLWTHSSPLTSGISSAQLPCHSEIDWSVESMEGNTSNILQKENSHSTMTSFWMVPSCPAALVPCARLGIGGIQWWLDRSGNWVAQRWVPSKLLLNKNYQKLLRREQERLNELSPQLCVRSSNFSMGSSFG